MNFIKETILFTAFCVILSACMGNEFEDSDNSEELSEKETIMRLLVGTMTRGEKADNGIVEKIKSLRIVMLSDGFVELNQKFDFSESENKDAYGFTHTLERATLPGNKSFYLIANEESVGEIKFEGVEILPEWITPDMNFESFLNHYKKDKLPAEGTLGYNNSGSGNEFESLINVIYYNPDYSVGNGEIYLPYTSYYSGYRATDDPSVTLNATMYLVPVATKFTFKFNNYRKEKVEVHEIHLQKVNTSNFLMAHLDERETMKEYNGKEFYWVDWLQKVATDSQRENGSPEFNDGAGWIENYYLPESPKEDDDYSVEIKITAEEAEDWTIGKLVDKNNPSTLTLTEYYPESINMGKRTVYNKDINDYEVIDAQVYKVRFKVQEIRDGSIATEPVLSEWMELDAVKALFRATHVVVNVDMYENIVEIYCEIAPWDIKKPFLGYLQEDD